MHLGKDKQVKLLAVFLLFSITAAGQPVRSYKYRFDGNMRKDSVISSNQSLIVTYSISDIYIEDAMSSEGLFYRISIPGHTPTIETGKPELPVMGRLISLPAGSYYKIKISEVKSSRIKPTKQKIKGILFPAQEGETKNFQSQKRQFKIDKGSYSAKGIIASDTVWIEQLGKARDNRLATLYISPLRYNPHSNTIEVITSMKIEISFINQTENESKSISSSTALFAETLEKGILNYSMDEIIPGYSDQPVKMVILTDTAFRKHLQPFIRWKTQKGFRIQVLYKGAIFAGNNYTELRDTLTKIYLASSIDDPPPEYLVIVGDVNKIPYYGTGNITDMYYGEFDGIGDYIPEMFIGRMPVADTIELKNVVNKIIQYEKFEFSDTNKFYLNALATTGSDAAYALYMNSQVKYAVSNYLTKANKVVEHHFLYPESLVKDSIMTLIKKGLSFINYTGHGDASGWLNPDIKVADISAFANKNMYPFIISNACRTSQFNLAASFGNKLLVSSDKGAIGFIGCSNDSYWDEDYYWAVGPGNILTDTTYSTTGLGAYDRLFHTHGESPSDWYFTMGQINYAGNMAVSASTTARKKYYWETYNLVGDPSVIPIIGQPGIFEVPIPDTLPNEIKSLSLVIPPFSYIAVSHFDTLWDASYASSSGSVTLDLPGLSEDSCLIVITGQNKIPLIKTVYFSAIYKEYINLTSVGINDINGNSNGVADYGETFYLDLKIKNLGLTDASELYAKISSNSGLITIQKDSVSVGKIPAGSEISLPDDLEIIVSEEVTDLSIATINLLIKDKSTEKIFKIDICLHAPSLNIISCTLDDSELGNNNHTADPGESFNLLFKVNNQGSSDISGQFDISSLSENLSILEPSVKSGILKFGEITDVSIPVKLSESALAGSYISVSSTLNCSPYILNKDFTFRIGRVRESFEALSFNVFPWINIDAIPWIITENNAFDGSLSAQSGVINHNGTSSLFIRTYYPSADSVRFYYKVSSELNYDYFSFKLNDKEIFRKSGDVSWTKAAIAVPPGLNKIEWVYKKDNSVSQGSDCAWVDMIDFTDAGSVAYIQKDLQVARITEPYNKETYSKETVTVKILNPGKDTINGFWLAYTINNNFSPVIQFFENTINPYSDSITVSFTAKASLSKYGIYNITVYGYNNIDDYKMNDTVMIKIENTTITESMSVFPNPFSDHFTLVINSRTQDNITISITSIAGVRLWETATPIINGNNEINISDLNLLPSTYYLNIKGTTINRTIPILRIR